MSLVLRPITPTRSGPRCGDGRSDILLSAGELVLGRKAAVPVPGVETVTEDPRVSRQHCRLRVAEDTASGRPRTTVSAIGDAIIVHWRAGKSTPLRGVATQDLQPGDEILLVEPDRKAWGASARFEGQSCAYSVATTTPLRLVPLDPAAAPWACGWRNGVLDVALEEDGKEVVLGRSTAAGTSCGPHHPLADPRISREHVLLQQRPGQLATCRCLSANGASSSPLVAPEPSRNFLRTTGALV